MNWFAAIGMALCCAGTATLTHTLILTTDRHVLSLTAYVFPAVLIGIGCALLGLAFGGKR